MNLLGYIIVGLFVTAVLFDLVEVDSIGVDLSKLKAYEGYIVIDKSPPLYSYKLWKPPDKVAFIDTPGIIKFELGDTVRVSKIREKLRWE